ncbi:hypothetical protein [Streptomyces prasinopilosus]|uniref:Uncharacterized protein n=1 Tax=Streptomyces prasinopilosus TaxID=67344 RepID=A0A1G6QRY5_9ACTN|nr:hypothetical protein [Streptomyces prasinopilosus]SDC95110.1 hypothetical protein SAMN05216505_104234 [Streptomyces prasinopilosus]
MTQSGQGEEPSARPAREGIVLPSDGGEPLLPGSTGAGAGPVAPGGREPGPAPSGEGTWGTPWGPGQQQHAPAPPSGQEWQSPPGPQWGGQEPAPWGARGPAAGQQGPGPLPPEDARPPAHGATHGTPSPYGQDAGGPSAQMPPQATGQGPGYGGYHGGDAYGPAAGAPDGYGQQGGGAQMPPQHGFGYGGPGGAYGPGALPDGSEGATQFMPPVPAAPVDEGATQFIPPVPAAPADEGATQFIPPVGPGALPPEMPAAHHAGANPYPGPSAQGRAGGPPAPAGNPDAEATQFMAPVTGPPQGPPQGAPYGAAPGGPSAGPAEDGNRQPPAEFDNLFRASGGDGGQAGSTQQMPRIEHPQPARPQAGQGGGGRRAARGSDTGGRGGRTGSKVPLIAAVGVGLVVLGIGAGALLGGGGGDDDGKKQPVSADGTVSEAPSAEPSAEPSVDPVREQAVELDKLLAHSGDSRSTVISSVEKVKACKDLQQAAEDLREAAGQRNQLVTDLSQLSVDKLPQHAALTDALTKAWQASASADNHYAAWADQTASRKGCRKGQARTTGETQAANRDSGTATAEKTKAAQLWNAIAKQHGLPERQPTDL